MKRTVILLLVLFLFTGTAMTAGASASYTLPEALKTVPSKLLKLPLPDDLPPYINIKSFTVSGSGTIHLELEDKVPQLKILEQDTVTGVESTIFSKKNVNFADARMVGKENSIFIIKMIWKLGEMNYVREYSTYSGDLSFKGCTATEEADPSSFAPYTSAVRSLRFNEAGVLRYETWALENETDRFSRTICYDSQGKLTSVKQIWESVAADDYQYITETNMNGDLTALTINTKKNRFYAVSLRLDESPDAVLSISPETLDSTAFDEQLARKYPQLAHELIDCSIGEDPTPIPVNARVWALNFGDFIEPDVYAFIATEPVLTLKNGKAILTPGAKDVNGDTIKLKKNKVTSPVLELAVIE